MAIVIFIFIQVALVSRFNLGSHHHHQHRKKHHSLNKILQIINTRNDISAFNNNEITTKAEVDAEDALLNVNTTKIHGQSKGDHVVHGDMMFTIGEENIIFEKDKKNNNFVGKARGSVVDPDRKWTPPIPYTLQIDKLGPDVVQAIELAMNEIEEKSCIRFIERTHEKDFLKFISQKGCWSYVGKRGGEQDISLSDGCAYKATVVHEIMHSFGFFHEQEREDRDEFVDIQWQNIQKGFDNNFEMKKKTNRHGTKYDFNSVMHYPRTAFGKRRYGIPLYTIIPKRCLIDDPENCVPINKKLGQPPNGGLSSLDAIELNKMYCVLTKDILEPILNYFLYTHAASSNQQLIQEILNHLNNLYNNNYYIYAIVYDEGVPPSAVSYVGYCAIKTLFRTLLVCYTWKTVYLESHIAWRKYVWKFIKNGILQKSGCDIGKIRNEGWSLISSYAKQTTGASMVVAIDTDKVTYKQGWTLNTPIKYKEDFYCSSNFITKTLSLMVMF